MIVVDSSVVLAIILTDDTVAYARAALKRAQAMGGIVPGNFFSEVCEALLRAERRRRLSRDEAAGALVDVTALSLGVRMPDPLRALELSRSHRITAYDGFYLALAREAGCPIATNDASLAEAAAAEGLYWSPEAT